jgi:hypothetical protein
MQNIKTIAVSSESQYSIIHCSRLHLHGVKVHMGESKQMHKNTNGKFHTVILWRQRNYNRQWYL